MKPVKRIRRPGVDGAGGVVRRGGGAGDATADGGAGDSSACISQRRRTEEHVSTSHHCVHRLLANDSLRDVKTSHPLLLTAGFERFCSRSSRRTVDSGLALRILTWVLSIEEE